MENLQSTKLQLLIRNEELAKCTTTESLNRYVYDVVLPLIETSVANNTKGFGGEVRVTCDRNGCSVSGSVRS